MSSDLLQANAADLEAAGQEFLTNGASTQETLTRMRNRVNALTGSFQGSAAQAFYSKMETLFTQMQTLTDEINEMGNDLNTTAAKVRQLQAEAEALLRD
jgi:WXG100 family type VII secretion target